MKSINVLILSAGRRVELVNCFKNAAKQLNIESRVIACDIVDSAPAIYFADKYHLIPRINEDDYIDSIIDVCNKESISLIIPTIDTELCKLAEEKDYIESKTNAKVLISDKRVVEICNDKNNSQRFFEENDFLVPKQIENIYEDKYEFPVFIKPLNGSSSINAFKVNNLKELEFFYEYIDNPIIQEFMQGEEYTVDIFTDFEGKIITIAPRIRLATRGGEVLKGKIVKNREIIDDIKRLVTVLNPIGHITVQCMKTDRGIEYIEINPRFGGGAPMTIDAGANSCRNLYLLLMGESLDYNEDYREGDLYLRFDNSIAVKDGKRV